ncbi:MAG: L-rhamnose isomerase [Verrucomicrobiae bacterium]
MSSAYALAQDQYAALGVDTETALTTLESVPISLHCWQGDDVGGFEKAGAQLTGGGIQATGNYPGKARSIPQLQQDLDKALSLIPGRHRLNLHACYADLAGKKIDRNEYSSEQFQVWISWCKERGMGMDFNPSYFSHPLADGGLTLSHPDAAVRKFWIEHGVACRKIAAEAARQLGSPAVTNFWIPDGSKDLPFDRRSPRERLAGSLDEIFSVPVDRALNLDAVESKLFGIGSESYVVGSHEFYLSYAVKRQVLYCLDAGHFHPTENLADKVSAILQFVPELLLHVSRGVRWDSDHVVLLDDPTRAMMEELVRGGFLARTHIGLDFFDASINRIAAWVIGTRSTLKALLSALLEPAKLLREAEESGDNTLRLALFEEAKTLPLGAVWDEYCQRKSVPVGPAWMQEVKGYEKSVLLAR